MPTPIQRNNNLTSAIQAEHEETHGVAETIGHAAHVIHESTAQLELTETVAAAIDAKLPTGLTDAIGTKLAKKAFHGIEAVAESAAFEAAHVASTLAVAGFKTYEGAEHASALTPGGKALTGALQGLGATVVAFSPAMAYELVGPDDNKPTQFTDGLADGVVSAVEGLLLGDARGMVDHEKKVSRGDFGKTTRDLALIGELASQ